MTRSPVSAAFSSASASGLVSVSVTVASVIGCSPAAAPRRPAGWEGRRHLEPPQQSLGPAVAQRQPRAR